MRRVELCALSSTVCYFCAWTIFGAAYVNEYPVEGHFTAGFVGEKTPSGLLFHSHTCRS